MLKSLVLSCVLSIAAVAQNPTAVTDVKQIVSKDKPDLQSLTIDRLISTRSNGFGAWSPDARQVAFVSNISGRSNLWLVPAEGGWPMQLTISEQRQVSPAWSPDGRWIAYESDYNGNEQWDLFLVTAQNGEVTNLTNTPQISEEHPRWSPNGKFLAYLVKPKTQPNHEIVTINVLTRTVRNLTQNTPKDLENSGQIWSRDGRWIAYTQSHASGRDSNVFVVEVATAKSQKLTAHTGEQNYTVTDYAPDGRKLLILSDAKNGFVNAALLDVATHQLQWITDDKWEVRDARFSPDGSSIIFESDVDGTVGLFRYAVGTGKSEPLALPAGVNTLSGAESPFTKDGSHLLLNHAAGDAPNDLWTLALADSQARQITHALVGGVHPDDLLTPTLVHYPSRDHRFTLSAWVYMPYNQVANAKTPAIVYLHGGPASQTMDAFNPQIQFLANQGYAVIAPNYRGSTGYGKQFEQANFMDMGGGDLQDILATADFIKHSPYIDIKKIVAMGGSYGGYLTMMAVTKAPEEWAAGVAMVPFVNWFTEVQNEDPSLQQSDYATMGDPVKDKALWEDRSPINFIDRVKAPLLLVAGGNDPRCPKSEAEQVAQKIRARGGQVELRIYQDEGHSFARLENRIDMMNRIATFLKVQVPAPGCGCTLE